MAALCWGCSELTEFDVPVDASGTVAGQLSRVPGVASGFDGLAGAGASVSRSFQNQGVSAGDLSSARLTVGTISVTTPPKSNLTWLKSFALDVSSPGLETKRIAHRDDFTAAQPSYDLSLDDVDLKPYVGAASMTFAPDFVRASLPAQDQTISLHLVLHVNLALGH